MGTAFYLYWYWLPFQARLPQCQVRVNILRHQQNATPHWIYDKSRCRVSNLFTRAGQQTNPPVSTQHRHNDHTHFDALSCVRETASLAHLIFSVPLSRLCARALPVARLSRPSTLTLASCPPLLTPFAVPTTARLATRATFSSSSKAAKMSSDLDGSVFSMGGGDESDGFVPGPVS